MSGNRFPSYGRNVIPGIRSPLQAGARTWIVLKWDRFALVTGLLGCETDVARADLFDFDNKTIRNLRQGGPVGDKTVAKILTVLRANAARLDAQGIATDFDEFFDVVVEKAA